MKRISSVVLILCCLVAVQAQSGGEHNRESADTLTQSASPQRADTALTLPQLPDTLSQADSATHQKLPLIKRDYDYKKQVWLAAGMMAFMALVITSAQTWNPR
ncbi:MAG: hypothetical protein ACLFQB_13920 [Chitinispirillaceae bacterium]